MSISESLVAINDEKLAQRTALIYQGIDMTNIPFTQHHEKILEITGGGVVPPVQDDYIRPSDRLPVPTINENEIYILFGVGEKTPNDYAINITCVGGYTVNWGDGITNNWVSNSVSEHLFDYNTLTSTTDSRGYKQVWIKITPQSTNPITQINLYVRPSTRPSATSANIFIPQVFEMYINTPSLITINWGGVTSPFTAYRMLEIFDYTGAVLNNASYFFVACNSLRIFNGAQYVNAASGFMYNCSSYNQPFPVGVTFSSVTSNFMYNCYSYNQAFPVGVTFSSVTPSFMNNCYSYNQAFPVGVTFSSVTSNFMNNCYSYNQAFPVGVTFSSVTTTFMNNCYSYNQPFPVGVTFPSVTASFMSGCYSYNQPFPVGVTFPSATSNFMYNCYSYNQAFPVGVTFSSVTSGFMYNCYSYNQAFPVGVTFSSVTTTFMSGCYSYNRSVSIYLQNITPIGTSSPGASNFAQKGLRLLNMGDVHNAITISNSSLDLDALVELFGDLYDRSNTTPGTLTITNSAGASSLTVADRLIATSKNWTLVG